ADLPEHTPVALVRAEILDRDEPFQFRDASRVVQPAFLASFVVRRAYVALCRNRARLAAADWLAIAPLGHFGQRVDDRLSVRSLPRLFAAHGHQLRLLWHARKTHGIDGHSR